MVWIDRLEYRNGPCYQGKVGQNEDESVVNLALLTLDKITSTCRIEPVEQQIKGMEPVLPPSYVWYVGIGSMMNVTAIKLRNIHPTISLACLIHDHIRTFMDPVGPASVETSIGKIVPAVAHMITQEEMVVLEGREPPSKMLKATIDSSLDSVWNGFTITSYVSVGVTSSITGSAYTIHGQPSERYYQMMVEGAAMAGSHPAALQQIQSISYLKETPIDQLKSFKISRTYQQYTIEELSQIRSNVVIFWNKILQLKSKIDEKKWNRKALERTFSDTDFTTYLTTQFYHPRYGVPSIACNNVNYWKYMENMASGFFFSNYEVIGYVDVKECTIGRSLLKGMRSVGGFKEYYANLELIKEEQDEQRMSKL